MGWHRFGEKAVLIFRVKKLALYVNASGSCDSVNFFEITESGVPGDGKFNSDQLVNLK
jgi:hypothetical protein